MTVPTIAKRLLDQTAGEHPVISAVFDLDPSEFATAPARATQATSLIDAGHNLEKADQTLNHDARAAVRADLDRLDGYLGSDAMGAAISHAGALAIYLSSGDDLFETVVLSRPATSSIVIARQPQLEPLVVEPAARRWCAVLVSERDVTIDMGTGAVVTGRQTGSDYVRGHAQSDGNDERSHAQDVAGHLIEVAEALAKDARAGDFDVLVLGGPVQALTGLEKHLASDVRGHLLGGAGGTALDLGRAGAGHATEADVAAAVVARLRSARAQEAEQLQSQFDDQLAAGDKQSGGRRAVAGIADVLEALTEQRVQALLLTGDFHAAGAQCPQCGLLYGSDVDSCPVDGTATAPVLDLREPMIAAAIRQDADVAVYDEPSASLGAPDHRVGALLRF